MLPVLVLRWTFLSVHLLVLGLVVAWCLAAFGPSTEPDDLAMGLGFFAMALLGSPWSWPLLGLEGSTGVLVAAGALAVVNLGAHVVLGRALVRRHR